MSATIYELPMDPNREARALAARMAEKYPHQSQQYKRNRYDSYVRLLIPACREISSEIQPPIGQ